MDPVYLTVMPGMEMPHLESRAPPGQGEITDPQNSSVASFISSLVFNGAVAVAFVSIFMIVRHKYPLVYAPRTFLVREGYRTPPIAKNLLAWLQTLKTSDDTVIDHAGEDAFSVVYYMRWAARVFGFMALVGMAILWPVHATANNGLQGLDRLTMGNIAQNESYRLWANVILSWVFVGASIWFIFRLLRQATSLRVRYLMSMARQQSLGAYALLVRDIPPDSRNEDTLRALFNRVQPDSVRAVVLSRDAGPLSKIDNKRRDARNKVESAATKYLHNVIQERKKRRSGGGDPEIGNAGARPQEKSLILCGAKRDAISHHLKELEKRQTDMEALTKKGLPPQYDGSAFIVFHDYFAPHVAAGVNLDVKPGAMMDKYAGVDPDDIIWNNLGKGYAERQARTLISSALSFALIIFWGIIAAFIGSIASIDKLAQIAPFLAVINDLPSAIVGIIQGVLPTVAISVAFSLIPVVLRLLNRFAGLPTEAAVERLLIGQYYGFLVFNVLFVVTIAGSLFGALDAVINRPTSIIEMLGTSIPAISSFFVNYVMLLALSGPAGELLQIAPLIVKPLILKYFAKTPRASLDKSRPPLFQSGVTLARHSFVATIGMTYLVIAPLVTLFVAIYFAFWHLAYTYQMQYVYVWKETGGFYLHTAAKQLFVALYIHEVVLFAIFFIKTAWPQGVLMLIALFATVMAQRHAELYSPLMQAVPAKAAMSMDRKLSGGKLPDTEPSTKPEAGLRKGAWASGNTIDNEVLDTNHLSNDQLMQANNASHISPSTTVEMANNNEIIAMENQSGENESGSKDATTGVEEDPQTVFSHPAFRWERLTLWVPRDPFGLAEGDLRKEITGPNVANYTTRDAIIDENGNIQVSNAMIAEFAGKRDTEF